MINEHRLSAWGLHLRKAVRLDLFELELAPDGDANVLNPVAVRQSDLARNGPEAAGKPLYLIGNFVFGKVSRPYFAAHIAERAVAVVEHLGDGLRPAPAAAPLAIVPAESAIGELLARLALEIAGAAECAPEAKAVDRIRGCGPGFTHYRHAHAHGDAAGQR